MGILDLGSVKGTNGQGVPTGGAVGMALVKSGLSDFVTEWEAIGRSNRNLLHNWDLRTPLNQRARTGAITNAYCIDRWIGNGTVTPSQGNHTVLANGTTMIQRMEILPAKLLSGVVTASIDIDGTIQAATLTFPSTTAGAAVSASLTGVSLEIGFVDLGSGNTSLLEDVASRYIPYLKVTATTAVNVRRVKLEAGSVSTLFADGHGDRAAMFSLCQRYRAKTALQASLAIDGYNIYVAGLPFPVPARLATPTVVVYGGISNTPNAVSQFLSGSWVDKAAVASSTYREGCIVQSTSGAMTAGAVTWFYAIQDSDL